MKVYQVDAFASELFRGNPAAICPIERWLPDDLMQSIAAENNLAETGFIVPAGKRWEIRWFTPVKEIALCGHATLAAGYLLLDYLRVSDEQSIEFESMHSGTLAVLREGERFALDFPSKPAGKIDRADVLEAALGCRPAETLEADNFLAVYRNEEEVASLDPDFARVAACHPLGVIVTAPGERSDFVSRYFAPSFGIDEDPATGSAHCTLTPYWAQRLGKTRLHGLQISNRVGEFFCEDRGERVHIAGQCRLYLEGKIFVD